MGIFVPAVVSRVWAVVLGPRGTLSPDFLQDKKPRNALGIMETAFPNAVTPVGTSWRALRHGVSALPASGRPFPHAVITFGSWKRAFPGGVMAFSPFQRSFPLRVRPLGTLVRPFPARVRGFPSFPRVLRWFFGWISALQVPAGFAEAAEETAGDGRSVLGKSLSAVRRPSCSRAVR